MTILEICVDNASGLAAAKAGGADRIELCSALELGGLTPSPGLMRLAGGAGLPIRAMIRPRAGDFVFNDDERDVMLADIAAVRAYGLAGVVLGANHGDGTLDLSLLKQLIVASEGLERTLHRAFDLVPDIAQAVEDAIALGFDTILTSGRSLTASAGFDDIRRAHEAAAGRITIMAGSGIDAASVGAILATAPLGAVHGSCSSPSLSDSPSAARLGFSTSRRSTDKNRVAALKAALL